MGLLIKLFWVFFKTGVLSFGGGLAVLPIIQKEVVDHFGWLSEQEFINLFAIANVIPGPIATKMSLLIGLEVGGGLGALVATLGLLLPSTILIVIVFHFFKRYHDIPFVQGMQKAVIPVIIVLILGVVLSMVRSSFFGEIAIVPISNIIIVGLFIVSIVVILLNEFTSIKIHPAYLILFALLIGGIFLR